MNKKNKLFKDIVFIATGVLFMSLSLNIFFEPNNIDVGGASGLAVVIKYSSELIFGFGIPLWITNIVLNIPLFIISFKVLGIGFIKKTIFATILFSIALMATENIYKFSGDIVLVCVFGSVLMGAGIGLILSVGATTGGSDLAASVIYKKAKRFSVAKIMLFIDVIIIAAGLFLFGAEKTLYAVISVYIISKIVDAVIEGFSFAKAAYIISDKWPEISSCLSKELERGATLLSGKGAYTLNEKNVLLCVVSKKEIASLKEIVANIDKKAFIIVSDIAEVLGEGFGEIS